MRIIEVDESTLEYEDTAMIWQSSTPYLQCEKYGGIALIVRKHHHPAGKF